MLVTTARASATSFYIAHDYTTTLNPADLSEMELDQNQLNTTYGTATAYGYGTFNVRSSMEDAPSITGATGIKHGQWQVQHSGGQLEDISLFLSERCSRHA